MKQVMVCGVARSGTSMTCGILNALGVPFHQTRITEKQKAFNPKGHFEDYDLIPLLMPCQQEFRHTMAKEGWPPEWRIRVWVNKVKPQLRVMQAKYQKNGFWGFKCQTKFAIPVLLAAFPNMHTVVVSRTLIHQAYSYHKLVRCHHESPRPFYTFNEALSDVTQSVYDLFRIVSHYITKQVTYVTFEEMREQPVAQAERLARHIGLEIDDAKREAVSRFVDDNLRTWSAG